MTVSTLNNRVSYAGNGTTTVFSFPNKFLADADLVVIVVVNSTGIATTKTLTTHYTVSGAGASAGGSVTMLTPPATGETIIIYRDPALTQPVDLVEGDPLPVETAVERGFDRLLLQIQRLRDLTDRAVRLNDADTTGANVALPVPVANRLIAWNAAATALENKAAADVSLTTVTAFIATLLDDTDAAAARTTLGAVGLTGNETIAGDKTLSGAATFTSTTKRNGASTDQGAVNYSAASGTDTYTSTHSPALTALNTGAEFSVYFANANTSTTPTWNPDGLGAKTIKRLDGTALLAGDISGQHRLRYNGTDMLLLNSRHILLTGEELGAATVTTAARNADNTLAASTAWVRDIVGEPSSDLTIFKCGSTNLPQNATRYLKAVGTAVTATEADAQVPITYPTEFYGMKIYLSEAVPNGQTIQVKVRKNAADTDLVTTITGPTAAGAVVNVNAPSRLVFGKTLTTGYDSLSVAVVTSATFGTTNDISVSLLARVPDSNYKPVSNLSLGAPTPAVGNYSTGGEFKTAVITDTVLNTVLDDGSLPLPNHVFRTSINTQNVPTVYANGVSTNTISGTTPVSVGDRFGFSEGTANTAFAGHLVFSDFDAGHEKGVWAPIIFSATTQAQGTARYMGGYGNASHSATENDVKIPVPAGTAVRLHAVAADAIPAGQSAVITIRKNGVDTALTVTLNNTNQYASDTINSVTFADNDLMSCSCTTSATAGSNSYYVVVELVKNTP